MPEQNEKIDSLTAGLPDDEGARRFFSQLSERHPAEARKLAKNGGLLSDALALAAFSPLLAATLLQNPAYLSWLARRRSETLIRGKEELLESLARFSLTNSQVEPQVLLARFRRRELLRIYLLDIRRLGTIAETTEEISNLADAVLEHALRLARQELDNRYGIPLEIDEKGRAKPAGFCVVSLGKLGSKELNYSSDIDLLFLYSAEGKTSGQGAKGAVTSREYFVKLAERVTKIVGEKTGEGAAYRVDLRLRPHGRVGALAVSVGEAAAYYRKAAQAWERQTLIRARASAGDAELFRDFYARTEASVYSAEETVEDALRNVRLSKEKIDLGQNSGGAFNVKLGKGGIREIEFIAQALQLAHGGRDPWLRSPHTLISLARLADRGLLSETEVAELSGAYEFLRRLEHRLQMEHGLQTHVVPDEPEKRLLAARRMNFRAVADFDAALEFHTANVSRIFGGVFGAAAAQGEKLKAVSNTSGPGAAAAAPPAVGPDHLSSAPIESSGGGQNDSGRAAAAAAAPGPADPSRQIAPAAPDAGSVWQKNQSLKNILDSLEKSETKIPLGGGRLAALRRFCEVSPNFAAMLAAAPRLVSALPLEDQDFRPVNYAEVLRAAASEPANFRDELAALRVAWTRLFLEIAAFDVFEKIDLAESKKLQTELAEASLETALLITQRELVRRSANHESRITNYELPFAVLGLGKLGGRGMDYGSDLDLVLVYDDAAEALAEVPADRTPAEFYSRAAEILVTTLSGFTREGSLYRVDLRLRPDGKNGAPAVGKEAFLNYIETRSAVWEWLAYVKLRGVSGAPRLALEAETRARRAAHERALRADAEDLKAETRRVRESLEREKTRGSKNVNIKYGAGGLLDVYFATRFLQLRDRVPDDPADRSTGFMLRRLREAGSLADADFRALAEGHKFLTLLDHNLRLAVGRSNQLPAAHPAALQAISGRMKLDSPGDLLEKLALHRIEIRAAYERILG